MGVGAWRWSADIIGAGMAATRIWANPTITNPLNHHTSSPAIYSQPQQAPSHQTHPTTHDPTYYPHPSRNPSQPTTTIHD